MAITKQYKIQIDGQEALATTGQLKKEIERLEEELDQVQLGSPEADAYVRELGKAKAALKGLEESVDVAFDKDKAGAFVDAAAGLAGAFEVGTIAATNFGLVSAESAEAYQQKLTEMIALVQGLESVHKLTTSEVSTALKSVVGDARRVIAGYFGMGEAATASGTAAATSGRVARLALAGIGIGALLLLLGLVVTNWDKITGAVERNRTKVVEALKFISPPIYGLISLLDLVEKKFGGVGQLVAGIGDAVVESFSAAGDILGKLLQGDVNGALAEARKFGTRTSEAFDKGVTKKNAELAQERDKKESVGRAERLKRQIAEEEAAGRDVYALKKKLLDEEIKGLDSSAKDYASKLADKNSEIRALTNAHNKQLADEAAKTRKEETDKQKATTDRAQREAEERYTKLRATQKEATEKEAADNEEHRKRLVAQARAYGGTQQDILRAEITAAQDAQTELMLNGKRYGSEWLALKEEIRVKEAQIIDANLADQQKAADERVALQNAELARLDEQQFGRLSRLQRAGASERQLDQQRLEDLREQAALMEKQGNTATRAYQEVLNAIKDTEDKLKPKALSVGDLILSRLTGLTGEKLDEVKQKIQEAGALISEAFNTLSALYFDNQQQQLDAQIEGYNKSIDALKERSQQIEQDLKDAQSTREALEKDLDGQKGARREATIARIAKERAEENRLAREKAKNDAAELKATKDKEAAEKKRQEAERKAQAIAEAGILITNAATAAKAVQAAVEATKSGAGQPFPANLIAIAAGIASVAAAVASAKKLANTVKLEKGGLIQGNSHALGGVPIGNTGIEAEGLEFVTNRRATINNLSTLETINRYGSRVQFIAVPKQVVRAAGGGQITEEGGLRDGGAGAGMVAVPTAQFDTMVSLLAKIAGHTEAVESFGPARLEPTDEIASRWMDKGDQHRRDANGGRLF